MKKINDKYNEFENIANENKTFILDFDGTLIYKRVNGIDVPSIISILREENHLDEDYMIRAKELFNYYHKIEKDTNISETEKDKYMREWWVKHYELKKEKGFNYKHLQEAIKSPLLKFRKGVSQFLKTASDKNINIIILSSAGLGYDSIKLLLERDGLMYNNINIISNKLQYDKDGIFIGFEEPLIYGTNKKEIIANLGARLDDNLIVIGDGLHDASIADNTINKNKLKIGIFEYYGEDKEELYAKYQEVYDIVLAEDEIDFSFVEKLIV